VRQALEGTAGVTKVEMRFDSGEFDVTFDPAKTSAVALAATVTEKGWKAAPK
jgi:copper chaperone CopZ